MCVCVFFACVLCGCSYDLIFSNGLLMYMSDTEVHDLFSKALSWLRPGGFMFFRETCFKAHGNIAVDTLVENVTHLHFAFI